MITFYQKSTLQFNILYYYVNNPNSPPPLIGNWPHYITIIKKKYLAFKETTKYFNHFHLITNSSQFLDNTKKFNWNTSTAIENLLNSPYLSRIWIRDAIYIYALFIPKITTYKIICRGISIKPLDCTICHIWYLEGYVII